MPLFTHLAGLGESVEGQKSGTWTPDKEYYDKFIRPEEEKFLQAATGRARSIGRAGRARQGGFLTAQGLGGTSLESQQQRGLSNAFRKALNRSLAQAQQEGEAFRRAKFAERDQARAESLGKISTVANLEGQIGSAILSSNQYTAGLAGIHSGSTAAAGLASTLGVQDQPNRLARAGGYDDSDPLETVDYGSPQLFGGGADAGFNRSRGGGGQDFLRQYGG